MPNKITSLEEVRFNQTRFFSLNKKKPPENTNTPFGLHFKEKMSQQSAKQDDLTGTVGASDPTHTPRGPDSGGCDVDVDF